MTPSHELLRTNDGKRGDLCDKQRAEPEVDLFFQTVKRWREELERLRAIALGCQLTEELKWGKPAIRCRAAMSPCCTNSRILRTRFLQRRPASRRARHSDQTRRAFAGDAHAQIHRRFKDRRTRTGNPGLSSGSRRGGEGRPGNRVSANRLARRSRRIQEPSERDARLKAAFEALTPGRRRGYLLYFSQPKQSKTRAARVENCIPRILNKKGLNDRD